MNNDKSHNLIKINNENSKVDNNDNESKDSQELLGANIHHCVKSVQIRSFFWSEYRKTRTRKYSVFGHSLRSALTTNISKPPG